MPVNFPIRLAFLLKLVNILKQVNISIQVILKMMHRLKRKVQEKDFSAVHLPIF